MSRPPRPYPAVEVSRGLPIRDGRLQVFGPSFAELVDTQVKLSVEELDQLPPSGEGDFARSLFDLSGVVAHVLGVYQDFFGGEAFLGTAQTQQSLLRHGRRLGYTADPGVSATGVVAFQVKAGLSGELPKDLPLLSVPKGEQGTENYETLEARKVDGKWNSLEPVDAVRTKAAIGKGARELEVDGVALDLEAGELLMLVRSDLPNQDYNPQLLTLESVREDAERGTTVLRFEESISDTLGLPLASHRLLAKPRLELRQFGWDADARIFPPDQLRNAGEFQPGLDTPVLETPSAGTTTVVTHEPNFGFEVSAATPSSPESRNLYLEREIDRNLIGQWIIRADDAGVTPLLVTHQSAASVSFVREQKQEIQIVIPHPDGDVDTSTSQFVPQWISASTTLLHVRTGSPATSQPRSAHDVRSRWLADFGLELSLRSEEPNTTAFQNSLVLQGDLGGLEPGMLVVLSTHDGRAAQLVELTSVVITKASDSAPASTTIAWIARSAEPAGHTFVKSDVVVLGNVVRVSHGKAVEEVLGDSDGVTPFQRFELKKSPVTQLPEATGAVPALEVRVGDVLWNRVTDFSESGPEDRHYMVFRNEAQVTSVLFGDGRKGAIPPAGRRNLRVRYRIGLGRRGNVEPGRLSRLQKAHPLVESARNPLPVSGGTEPAVVEQVKREATRLIRTFDRAVSTSDYSDLALLFPGVARSKARSDPGSGVELVLADADGNPLGDVDPFLRFLDARRDRSVPLRLRNPVPVDIVLRVQVEHDPAFFKWQVEQAVRDVLCGSDENAPGLFTFRGREFGEPAFLSQVYEAVQRAPGVVFSQVLRFDLDRSTAPKSVAQKKLGTVASKLGPIAPKVVKRLQVRDAIHVASHEWLRLPLDKLSVEAAVRKEE